VFGVAIRLTLPCEVAHPVKQTGKLLRGQIDDASGQIKKSKPGKAAGKAGRSPQTDEEVVAAALLSSTPAPVVGVSRGACLYSARM
jgi:hypothetical protein